MSNFLNRLHARVLEASWNLFLGGPPEPGNPIDFLVRLRMGACDCGAFREGCTSFDVPEGPARADFSQYVPLPPTYGRLRRDLPLTADHWPEPPPPRFWPIFDREGNVREEPDG